MAKGRGGRGREEKKPKADKKAAQVASSFLHPQPSASTVTAKGNRKQDR
jgi:hypothetical protein